MEIYLTLVVLIVQMDVAVVLVVPYYSAIRALLILIVYRIILFTEQQHAHLSAQVVNMLAPLLKAACFVV
jgi:hypothetical protein